MTTLLKIEILIGIAVAILELLALFVGWRALAKGRDARYRKKYQEHLRLKHEVQDNLQRTKKSLGID